MRLTMGSAVSGRIDRIREEFSQLSILSRHFLVRLMESEGVSFPQAGRQQIISVLALLAVLGCAFACVLLYKNPAGPGIGTLWPQECAYLTFLMMMTAFVVVLGWESMLLDRQDYQVLYPLPLRPRTIFLAKTFSLMIMVGAFFLSLDLLPSLFFAVGLQRISHFGLLGILKFWMIYLGTGLLASGFAFLIFLVIHMILSTILPKTIYRFLNLYIQVFFLAVFILFIIYFASAFVSMPEIPESLKSAAARGEPFAAYFPPLGYAAVAELMTGNKDPLMGRLALRALSGMAGIVILYLTGAAVLMRQQETQGEPRRLFQRLVKPMEKRYGLFKKVFLRSQVQHAIFDFTVKTLVRSSPHKLIVAAYASVPLAVALGIALFSGYQNHYEDFNLPEKALLLLPHLFGLFVLLGIKASTDLPLNINANWVFGITESGRLQDYAIGFKKAILVAVYLPLIVILAVVLKLSWNWVDTLFYCLYCALVFFVLLGILLFSYRKVPFASALTHKGAGEVFLRLLYAGLGGLYVYAATALGAKLLRNRDGLLPWLSVGVLALAAIGIRLVRFSGDRGRGGIQLDGQDSSGLDLGG
ncbi:MAG: hypothetical protein NTU60_09675 [Candidatus Aminicenantes bacterium]|nr:hypothetical protein [Candidatus Aminicenantes bacterium]